MAENMTTQSMTTTVQQVKETLTGASLSWHWWTPFAALEKSEKTTAAIALMASDEAITGRKKLADTSHPALRRLGQFKAQVKAWWEYHSMPYVFDGIRLIRREQKEKLFQRAEEYRLELSELAYELDVARDEILTQGRQMLGSMFSEGLYPALFSSRFGLELRERSIEPPSYLCATNSEEYQRELARTLADIERSARTFEQQLWRELQEVTSRLAANMTDGSKVMNANFDSAKRLFDRVALMNFEGTAIFRRAMSEAQDIIDGISPEEIRASKGLKQKARAELTSFMARVEQMTASVREVNEPESEEQTV